jgi:ABC-2 type transport system permease protein
MNPRRIWAVIYRHGCEARRNLNRITDTVYWPVQNIIVWGFFTLYLSREHRLEPGVVSYLLGATMLWGMFYSFQRDLATGFMEELWSRNLLNLFCTPLNVSEYITGLILLTLLKALLGLLLAVLIAWLCYAENLFPALPGFVPFLLVLIVFSLSIGLVITGLIIRFTTKIQTLAWSFAGLLMPLSCVYYPVATLPGWLRPLAWALPTMHAFEGMRELVARGTFSSTHFQWGMTLNLAYFVFAVVFFRWMFVLARSRGFLVRQE